MTENVKEAIKNAIFGNKFLARNGKQALFLRLAENSEYKFAFFYIQDWGVVQVFLDGREVHGYEEYDIVKALDYTDKLMFVKCQIEMTNGMLQKYADSPLMVASLSERLNDLNEELKRINDE